MRIKILIKLKNQILEPQGKVIEQSLKSLGFEDFSNIRQGKLIEIDLPDSLNEEERSKKRKKRGKNRHTSLNTNTPSKKVCSFYVFLGSAERIADTIP